MTDFNQVSFMLKIRSCSRQPMEHHVPLDLNSCKNYLPKSVSILLGQPVLLSPSLVNHASLLYNVTHFQIRRCQLQQMLMKIHTRENKYSITTLFCIKPLLHLLNFLLLSCTQLTITKQQIHTDFKTI